ncbi:MAG: OsmC family protein [Chitinophagales bacterium]
MPTRKAQAQWNGGLKNGKGNMKFESGAFSGQYSFSSRFEDGTGTNPEELIAAAHAGCFSMALSAELEKADFNPKSVSTQAHVKLEKQGEGFGISNIKLVSEAEIPEIDNDKFQELANGAKKNCPVSQALKSVNIELEATLK